MPFIAPKPEGLVPEGYMNRGGTNKGGVQICCDRCGHKTTSQPLHSKMCIN